jgi:hypothetical protein
MELNFHQAKAERDTIFLTQTKHYAGQRILEFAHSISICLEKLRDSALYCSAKMICVIFHFKGVLSIR